MPLSLIRDSGDMNRADSPSDSYPQPFFRFHPNCVQRDQTASCPIPITGSSSLQSPESGITSESTPVVKSCKHCSFSFRSDGKHAEVDFCSKGNERSLSLVRKSCASYDLHCQMGLHPFQNTLNSLNPTLWILTCRCTFDSFIASNKS